MAMTIKDKGRYIMKNKILIIDDSQINREFLSDILCDDYHILLAENGVEGVALIKQNLASLSLVLLDLVMPEMNGFEVLEFMNKNGWIHDIPVIMISSENSGDFVEKAYELGASDFINRPFNINIVRKRVSNIVKLFSKQRKLKDILTEQIYEKEKRSALMIAILSHIVEFRNGESGLHILHINAITEKLLKAISTHYPDFGIDYEDISLITTASSLHDIGKISIPDEILNKPGRLTKEEFEIMKTHSEIGANILKDLKWNQQDPLLKVAYEICRWHHERWDGRGYPDGLKGDEIPLSAQVVALADVYDALTSERCYKKAFSHEKAVNMITNGECGTFNPVLLDCFVAIADELRDHLETSDEVDVGSIDQMVNLSQEINKYEELSMTKQMMYQLEMEKQKYSFLSEKLTNLTFVYNHYLDIIFFSRHQGDKLITNETVISPLSPSSSLTTEAKDKFSKMLKEAQQTTIDHPEFEFQDIVTVNQVKKLCHFTCRTIWYPASQPVFMGIVGIADKEMLLNPVHQEMINQVKEIRVENNNFKLSFMQAKKLLMELKQTFSIVRFIDIKDHKVVYLDDHNEMVYSTQSCYSLWNKNNECVNCFFKDKTAREQGKYETVDNEVYYVVVEYVEIDSKPYALELGTKIEKDMLEAHFHNHSIFESLKKLQEQLYHDGLTDAYNRRYLDEEIYEGKTITAVAMVDLDRFKDVNDRFGHLTGDQVLKDVVNVIKHGIREKDALIRYGGDEFVILFDDIPTNIIEDRLNQLRQDVSRIVIEGYEDLKINCSIGCAIGHRHVSEMVVIADNMLYQAKLTRNTVAIKYVEDE